MLVRIVIFFKLGRLHIRITKQLIIYIMYKRINKADIAPLLSGLITLTLAVIGYFYFIQA